MLGLGLGGEDVSTDTLNSSTFRKVCEETGPSLSSPPQPLTLPSALHILPGQLLAHSDLMQIGRGCKKMEVDVDQRERNREVSMVKNEQQNKRSGRSAWRGSPPLCCPPPMLLPPPHCISCDYFTGSTLWKQMWIWEWASEWLGGVWTFSDGLELKMFHCPKRTCVRFHEPE